MEDKEKEEEIKSFEDIAQTDEMTSEQILPEKSVDEYGRSYATGKRKDAVARVWLKQGSGNIKINGKSLKIPNLFNQDDLKENVNSDIKEALIFNKNLLLENFILPNKLKFPLFRNILEKYYN